MDNSSELWGRYTSNAYYTIDLSTWNNAQTNKMNPNEYVAFVTTELQSVTYQMKFYNIGGATNFIYPGENINTATNNSLFNVSAGDEFTITDSTSNNGTYTVKSGGSNNILDGGSIIYVEENLTGDATYQLPTITGSGCFNGTKQSISEWFELQTSTGIGISLENIQSQFVGDTLTINWDTLT